MYLDPLDGKVRTGTLSLWGSDSMSQARVTFNFPNFLILIFLIRGQHSKKLVKFKKCFPYHREPQRTLVDGLRNQGSGADPGGGRWGPCPSLGNTLFNSIQTPVHHWAPSPGRNPVSRSSATLRILRGRRHSGVYYFRETPIRVGTPGSEVQYSTPEPPSSPPPMLVFFAG